jgi:hypothetical protein
VQKDEKVVQELARFEAVEWCYDGLNGKIIPWTLANGNTHEDPSVLAFVVAGDGKVVARADDAVPYRAASFSKWLAEQAAAYARSHPKTAMPFLPAEVTGTGEGEKRKVGCAELDAAKRDGKPVLLYFGREARKGDDKAAKKAVAASKKLEQKALDSKAAAEAAKGWVLLRFDLADPDHRRVAKAYGVARAPRLILIHPDEEKPVDLGGRISASSLKYQLRKERGED